MKVAIYARVSTTDQDAGNQERLCREYCERADHQVFAVYRDDGVSGAKTSRPAFNRLLEDMRLIRFNCIMVVRLDRIGRSLQHILSLFEEFNRLGVHFVAVTQNIDTASASGKLQMQLLAAFSEFERNIISERTKEGLSRPGTREKVGKRGPDKVPRKRRGVLRTPLFSISKVGAGGLPG